MSTYVLDGVLCEDADVALHRAHSSNGQRVILRSLRNGHAPSPDVEWLRCELENSRLVGADVTPLSEGFDSVDGRPALVLRDDGVESLACIPRPLDVGRVLDLALPLTEAIASVHARRMLHANLRPSSILVTRSGGVELIGFRDVGAQVRSTRPARGMWPYLSPEQTGRLGLPVDHRSDLYSLGIVLFELLTGRLPFGADDLLGWIHGHCAVAPAAPSALAAAVPERVSDVVLKLLAKQPEDRYQSGAGVRHDLARIRATLATSGAVEAFTLGAADTRPPIQLKGRLYGREAELATIDRMLGDVAARGRGATMILRGPGGIGKTALLERLADDCSRRGLLIGVAACGPIDRDVPHGGLVRALDRLVAQAADASGDRSFELGERLRGALGVNLSLIGDRVRSLQRLVGATEPPVEVPAREAERRFVVAIAELVGALTSVRAPVVLVIDDLQWADASTLDVVERLPQALGAHAALLVVAHRDTGLPAGHPLHDLRARWEAQGRAPLALTIGELPRDVTARWIADALRSRPDDVEPLAAIVHARSGGNPFAISQMVCALEREGMIRYSTTERAWSWDLDAIRAKRYADAAADVVVGRLHTLSASARDALRLFACHGGSADLAMLAIVLDLPEQDVLQRLGEAFDAGLIARVGAELRFLHDRIQQAAERLTPPDRRAETHLAIMRALLARLSGDEVRARIFEIVHHVMDAAPLILSSQERTRAAEICAIAGRRAQAVTDHLSAVRYFAAGMSLLPPDCWQTTYELAFGIHFELKRSRFATGDVPGAEGLCATLRAHARSRSDAAAVDALLADLQVARGDLEGAVATCRRALHALGTELPERPSAADLDAAYAATLQRLGERPVATIEALSPARSLRARLASDLLSTIRPAAALGHENLAWLAACASVDLALEHGCTASSTSGYAVFAGGLALLGERYREAFALGEAAYRIACRDENVAYRPRAAFEFLMTAGCLGLSARECVEIAEREREVAVALGDQTFACYFAAELTLLQLQAGEHLDDLASAAAERLAFVEGSGMRLVSDWIARQGLAIACLRGDSSLDDLDAAGRATRDRSPGERLGQAMLALRATYILGDMEGAARAAEEAAGLARFGLSVVDKAAFHLFAALAAASRSERVDGERLAIVRAHHEVLYRMGETGSHGFGPGATLVGAEVARLEGDELAAERAYEKAIRDARWSALAHVEAIASERASAFHRARGFERLADVYLVQARDGFEAWGARAKVASLTRAHPQLARSGRVASWADSVDVEGIVKASQAMSSTLLVAEVPGRVLSVLMEHAGAQRGFLLAQRGSELVLAASGGVSGEAFGRSGQPADGARLPLSLCRTVARTRRAVVIPDATQPHRFDADPYFVGATVRSVLGMPIPREDSIVGVLYLENNLVTGAFTGVRLSVADVLARQAGISLENARLFGELQEENVRRRRVEASLEDSRWRLQSIIDNSTAVIFVKDVDGRYLLVNRRYEQLFHVRGEEIAGRTDLEIFVREQAERFREDDRRVLEERRPIEFDDAVSQDDGVHEYLSLKFPLSRPDGSIYGVGGIATDVTTRNRLLAAERRAREEAEEALRLRDEFLSVASHELRTPLTSLMLAVQSLDPAIWRNREFGRAQQIVERATRQIRRLSTLVGLLLDVSRVRTERLVLHRKEVDLRRVVEEVVSLMAHELGRSGSSLTVSAPEPAIGWWDEQRLEQVVTNLLSNAIKFGNGEPIEVHVAVEEGGREATLVIEDRGPGIPSELVPRLFQPFQRGVSARHYGGLGLGLYITREIIEAHGGRIHAESTSGAGARFVVELPRGLDAHGVGRRAPATSTDAVTEPPGARR